MASKPSLGEVKEMLSTHKVTSIPRGPKLQEIETTLTTCNYFNLTTEQTLDFVVYNCGEWAAFSALYDEFKVSSIKVDLDFHRHLLFGDNNAAGNSNTVLLWAYDPTVSAAKSFDKVADYSNSEFVPYSAAHPVVSRVCKPLGEVVTASSEILKGWQMTSEAANCKEGSLLLSGPAAPVASNVPLFYKIVWTVRFRLRQGT